MRINEEIKFTLELKIVCMGKDIIILIFLNKYKVIYVYTLYVYTPSYKYFLFLF